MSTPRAQKRAIWLMLACSSLWSIAGIFIKMLPWNPFVIAGWRSLISSVCVAAYLGLFHMRLRINRDSLVSAVMVSTTFLSFVCANKLTTAANAIVLQFTAPVFILLLSAVLFQQKFSRADLITVVVTMLGIALFFFDQLSPGNFFGNCVSIFAGLALACMYLATGHADEESRMSGILLGHLLTAVIGIPFMFFFDTPLTGSALGSILALGIVQLGIPYILYGIAVKDCPPLVCSLLGAVEPLLNPLWVFLFDGERPGVFALCGGIVVIVTITIWCVRRDRNLTAQNDL